MNFDQLDFREFPFPSESDWIAAIEKELKGRSIEEITFTNLSGINYKPFYSKNDRVFLNEGLFTHSQVKHHQNHWSILESFCISDESDEPYLLYEALEYGANAINVSHISLEKMHTVFDKIHKSFIQTFFILDDLHLSQNPYDLYDKILTVWQNEKEHVKFSFLPSSYLLKNGQFLIGESEDQLFFKDIYKKYNTINSWIIDGTIYHNSGFDSCSQIAWMIHQLSDIFDCYLSELDADIIPTIIFKISIGPNWIEEIAKINALKIAYQRLCKAWNVKPNSVYFWGVSSYFYQTRLDPYNNLLRHAIEGLAAISAGVDYLEFLPFDVPDVKTSTIRRWNRNIHHLLVYESKLTRFINPMAGSFAMENITKTVTEKAWEIFCNLEDSGTFTQHVLNGTIAQQASSSFNQRIAQLQEMKIKLTGVNLYPDKNQIATLDALSEEFPVVKGKITEYIKPVRLAASLENKLKKEHETGI